MMIEQTQLDLHSVKFTQNGITIQIWPEFALDSDVDKDFNTHSLSELIDESEKNPDQLYIPGTFTEQINGYLHNTLPVISNGEFILKRNKIKSSYRVIDWVEAANTLGLEDEKQTIEKAIKTRKDPTLTEMDLNEASEILDILYKGPKRRIQNQARDTAKVEAVESVSLVQINELNILPVICNELQQIESCVGKKPDIIAESSFYFDNWRSRYSKLIEDGFLSPGTHIIRADGGNPDQSGIYKVQQEALERVQANTG